MEKKLWQLCLAEAIGTFFLCFIGIGAILSNTSGSGIGLLGIALAHGIALAIGITATGHISGGHLNPAVSCGFMATGRLAPVTGVAYIISQCVGALVAAALISTIYSGVMAPNPATGTTEPSMSLSLVEAAGLGTPAPGQRSDGKGEWGTGAVFLTEFALTFLLITAVFGTAVDDRAPRIGGFGIGLTVTYDILVGGPISGAAMNPARVFGPAVVGGIWNSHWVYWAAPIAGAVVGALVYHHLLMPRQK